MRESYTMPPERKRWELFSLNVPKPWHAPLESKGINDSQTKPTRLKNAIHVAYYKFVCLFTGPGPGKGETFQVPWMYNTEYQFYGSEKPVTI